MADINLVIIAQIILFIVVCLGPILIFVSRIRGTEPDSEDDEDRSHLR